MRKKHTSARLQGSGGSAAKSYAGVLTIVAALALGSTARAVSVSGVFRVRGTPTTESAAGPMPAYYWQERNGVVEPTPDRLHAPRALTAVLLGTSAQRPPSHFAIEGGDFSPRTFVAQAGSTLRIQNTDPCSHELFAEGIDEFTPLQTAPGNARTLRAPTGPGHWTIRDRIYPHVRGHLHVVPNLAARARITADGRFVFEDVAPGNYELKVFYRDKVLVTRKVEVKDGRGMTLEDPVTLKLPQGGRP